MNVLAFFTKGGVPAVGLNATIQIREVATGIVVVNWAPMTEIGDGWYRHDFSYMYTKEYVATIDGSAVLSNNERFMFSAKDNTMLDIEKIVWDANVSQHQNGSSFGQLVKATDDNLKRALGLMHENIYIDNPVYDADNNLVSARIRIYASNTDVGTNNGVLGTYTITSNGSGPGKFSTWSQIII